MFRLAAYPVVILDVDLTVDHVVVLLRLKVRDCFVFDFVWFLARQSHFHLLGFKGPVGQGGFLVDHDFVVGHNQFECGDAGHTDSFDDGGFPHGNGVRDESAVVVDQTRSLRGQERE